MPDTFITHRIQRIEPLSAQAKEESMSIDIREDDRPVIRRTIAATPEAILAAR